MSQLSTAKFDDLSHFATLLLENSLGNPAHVVFRQCVYLVSCSSLTSPYTTMHGSPHTAVSASETDRVG